MRWREGGQPAGPIKGAGQRHSHCFRSTTAPFKFIVRMTAMQNTTGRRTTASPRKRGRRRGGGEARPSHPAYKAMVKSALAALNDRKGSSRAAILSHIVKHYELGNSTARINARLRQALSSGLASGTLERVKGTGLNGSFRLSSGKTRRSSDKPKRKPLTKTKGTTKSPRKPKAKKAMKSPGKPKPNTATTRKSPKSKPKRQQKIALPMKRSAGASAHKKAAA